MPATPIDPRAEALAASLAMTEGGDRQRSSELFAVLYRELHRLARRQIYASGGVDLSATTLLHEAYLNLSERTVAFPDRGRFMAYAARAMRALIIDHVRERRAAKRGGDVRMTVLDTLATDALAAAEDTTDLPALGEGLDALAAAEPALAELVELKFFCGFDFTEIATLRGVSERTVQRDWQKARLFLRRAIGEGRPAP